MIAAFKEQEGCRLVYQDDEGTVGLFSLLESLAYQTTTSEAAELLGHQAC